MHEIIWLRSEISSSGALLGRSMCRDQSRALLDVHVPESLVAHFVLKLAQLFIRGDGRSINPQCGGLMADF
eukprot:scaffold159753_cov43-Tisochrysis_lutea.AAC.2